MYKISYKDILYNTGNIANIYTFKFIFWLSWFFVAVRGLSLVVASGGYSLLRCVRFSLRWLLFVAVCGLLIAVPSLCCGARALGTRAAAVVARGL